MAALAAQAKRLFLARPHMSAVEQRRPRPSASLPFFDGKEKEEVPVQPLWWRRCSPPVSVYALVLVAPSFALSRLVCPP